MVAILAALESDGDGVAATADSFFDDFPHPSPANNARTRMPMTPVALQCSNRPKTNLEYLLFIDDY
ncbi:MAG TPA: hypothetical protein VFF11_06560 [Candidatus Binatia bacterium]|nr:hypothetical protein [Candidatus Binatia bacterium]